MALPFIGLVGATIVGGAVSLLSFGPGAGDFFTRQIYDFLPTRIAGISDLIRGFKRGDIDEAEFRRLMRENGYSEEQQDIITRAALDRLGVREILTLWFRYKDDPANPFGVNRQWLESRLASAGIDSDSYDDVIEANRPVPTLEDVIRFAMRDVYEPEQVRLGGLMEGLPPRFVKEAARRGLKEDDALLYWAAHWNFPSTFQVFEMLHRLFDDPRPDVRFTEKDMDTYFNVADIAPGMRERLKAIAYKPVGRVDIRRFDRLGIYGTGEERKRNLTRAYMELGFNQTVASQQTEFTLRLNDTEDKEFTRAQILALYREGLPKENTRAYAEEQLTKAGFPEDRVKLMLDLEDRKIIDAEEQAIIDGVIQDIINGRLQTDARIRDALTAIDLSPQDLTALVADVKKQADKQAKRPSVSKAEQFFRAGLISEAEFRTMLKANNVAAQDIDAYVELNEDGQAKERREPSKEDIVGWYSSGLIDGVTFRARMRLIGYEDADINLYAASAGFPLEDA